MAYYGGEEQRKKDEKKAAYEKRLKSMLPKRAFDQMGRELDPRSGKLLEDLLSDPLAELWDLHEAEMAVQAKPDLQDAEPSNIGTPNSDNYEHPITQRRNEVDKLIGTGMTPTDAHQQVHGEINTSDIESKSALAATLGRVQEDGNKKGVKIEKDKQSILARDAEIEKALDQVTRNDLRTPMNQQVPDRQQTPGEQVAEELETEEEYDYNLDVDYLQKFGRA